MKLQMFFLMICGLFFQGVLLGDVVIDANPSKMQQAIHQIHAKNVENKDRLPSDFGLHEILQESIDLECDDEGYPTQEALQKMIQAKLLRAQNFSDITIKVIDGGYWTDRVYAVGLKGTARPIFFIKISRKHESADSIITIQKTLIGRLGMHSRYADSKLLVPRKNLPIICWIEAIFSYTNSFNKASRLEVIHAARGVSVNLVVTKGTIEEVIACGRAFGFTLGSFQQVFMNYHDENDCFSWTTVAHNDLHPNNCFFDYATNRIYWIDIDTMGPDQSIWNDISLITKISNSLDLRWNEFAVAALSGYFESFSPQRQLLLKEKLKVFIPLNICERLGVYDLDAYSPFVRAIVTDQVS